MRTLGRKCRSASAPQRPNSMSACGAAKGLLYYQGLLNFLGYATKGRLMMDRDQRDRHRPRGPGVGSSAPPRGEVLVGSCAGSRATRSQFEKVAGADLGTNTRWMWKGAGVLQGLRRPEGSSTWTRRRNRRRRNMVNKHLHGSDAPCQRQKRHSIHEAVW